jgi:hypothetical protein
MGQPAQYRRAGPSAGKGGTVVVGPTCEAQASRHLAACRGGTGKDGPASAIQVSRHWPASGIEYHGPASKGGSDKELIIIGSLELYIFVVI